MTITLSDLPPNVILEHNETLHAIVLPPLATFLHSLSKPEHLIKLRDILDRYRTPKSYHRIDVREMESSELPLASPVVNSQKAEDLRKDREFRENGEPIVLPPQEEMDALTRHLDSGDIRTEVSMPNPPATAFAGEDAAPTASNGSDPAPEQRNAEAGTSNGNGPSDEAGPSTCASQQPASPPIPPLPDDDIEDSITVVPRAIYVDPLAANDTHRRLNSPEPVAPLPPAPPRRRVRELRLDLRTLDAAALFALETWRRQLMGLDKLPMDHPDSIWYNDPDPPSPPPTLPIKSGKKKGRPKKHPVPEALVLEDTDVDNPDVRSQLGAGISANHTEDFGSLVEELRANGLVNEDGIPANEVDRDGNVETNDNVVSESMILSALSELDGHIITEIADVEPEIIRSPSPDVILNDAFNETEDQDPDFEPVTDLRNDDEDVEAPRVSLKRQAKPAMPTVEPGLPGTWGNPIPTVFDPSGGAAGDDDEATPLFGPIKKRRTSTNIVDTPEGALAKKRRARPPKTPADPVLVITRQPPSLTTPLPKGRMVLEAVEVPSSMSKTQTKQSRASMGMSVRFGNMDGMAGDDEDEEDEDEGDEWGFLRGM